MSQSTVISIVGVLLGCGLVLVVLERLGMQIRWLRLLASGVCVAGLFVAMLFGLDAIGLSRSTATLIAAVLTGLSAPVIERATGDSRVQSRRPRP